MKELVDDLKIANDNLYSANKMLEKEIERLDNIIDDLLTFIKDMIREEAISEAFGMTTNEFIEYVKEKLKSGV